MADRNWARRTFLRRVGQSIAALSLDGFARQPAEAQKPSSKPFRETAQGPLTRKGDVRLNVRDLGARGDGKAKDTVSVQLALDRCAVLDGGEVLIPAGEYICGTLRLHSNTTLRLDQGASLMGSPDLADYPFTQVRWEGRWLKGYSALITAQDAENVTILGKGEIIASPAIKGRYSNIDGSPVVFHRPPAGSPPDPNGPTNVARKDVLRHPALMEFTRCRKLLVQDVFTQGNDMWSTHPVYCEDVTFRNVTVHSGADGIDVDSCRNVVIEGCTFETRDDCISLKSGRGMEGNTIGIPCEGVRISNCTFNDAVWACIGIGSETSGGIRNVLVEHCRCLGARTFAIYIKSRPGRGAFIENITMNNLEISNTGQGFLRFNILNSGLQDPNPVPGDAGIPTIRNFRFTNIHVDDVPVLVDGSAIHPHKPLDGLVLENITGTCGRGIELANTTHAVLRNIKVTGFTGPLLSTHNVTGRGLEDAVPLPEAKIPDAIQPPAAAYVLQ